MELVRTRFHGSMIFHNYPTVALRSDWYIKNVCFIIAVENGAKTVCSASRDLETNELFISI
jgi:hypothetical protein